MSSAPPTDQSSSLKKTTLCFIKNVAHNFTPVEKYLKKRDFEVILETDIKVGLNTILEKDPDYIFLAWDHKNEAIRQMPKLIYQSSVAHIVPFIMSTQRDQIIQLESSGFENKLYPPLSGPAILRVIQKHEKQNSLSKNLPTQKKNAKKESEMIQVKSFFSDEQKPTLDDIKITSSQIITDDERKISADQFRARMNLIMPENNRKSGFYLPQQTKHLSSFQKARLEDSYAKSIRPEMFELMEAYSDFENESVSLKKTKEVYLLIVEQKNWTGYLTVASESFLEIESAEEILNNWIQTLTIEDTNNSDLFDKISEINTEEKNQLLKISIPEVDFNHFCNHKADFFKELDFSGKKTILAFFSFSPHDVMLTIHETQNLYLIPGDLFTFEKVYPIDLQVHLPENNKFVLYKRPGFTLTEAQVDKFKSNQNSIFYTGAENEKNLLKLKAEYNLNRIITHHLKAIKN